MIFLSQALSSNRLCNPADLARRRRSSRESFTRMRLMSGRSGSKGRLSWSPARIPVFAGRITRSSLTTAAGTESTANHNFNWHDSIHDSVGNPCGNDSQQPCDDFFHGSHTTGTAIGDDGGTNQIGMAPGARWIACRNMDEGNGTPARYIECMEFFLAPYPLNCTPNEGDPTKAPDITINSWGCPTSEGCTTGDELRVAVEAQEAAGIQMVVAAGNSGPSCSTVSDPPSFYDASYTVGALNTGTDTIASFSSLGPVTRDGSNRTKPDITAPGTNTRSASNAADSAYTFASGTSMATPHIAGAMALLWSAIPSLQHQIEASRDALDNSAVEIDSAACPPGDPTPPNNVYGWGESISAAAVGPGTNTKCLAYSCIKRYPLRGYESDSDANCNSNGYRYPNSDEPHRNGHGYSYSNAQTDAHAQVCADTEASSHTAAQTVDSLSRKQTLSRIGDRDRCAIGPDRLRTTARARGRVALRSRLTMFLRHVGRGIPDSPRPNKSK